MPYPLPLTRTEAYLAYKAGVIQQSDLKPPLAIPRNGIDAWLAYWTGLAADYPKREDGTPHILQEEEAYIAYLCGVINEYPEKCLRRVGAYLRYLISARWGRPDHPLNREELYLSLIKTQFIPSGEPSSNITLNGTCKAAFVDVKVYGDSVQATESSYNMLPIDMPIYTSKNGVTVAEDEESGIITINGTCSTNNTTFDFYDPSVDNFTLGSGKYTLKLFYVSGTVTNPTADTKVQLMDESWGHAKVVVLQNQTAYNTFTDSGRVISRANIRIDSGVAFDNYKIKLMLCEGGEPEEWSRWVGGEDSPNPVYPQPIKGVTGAQTIAVFNNNLLNYAEKALGASGIISVADLETGRLNISGTNTSTWPQITDAFILDNPIPSGTTLTLSVTEPLPTGWDLYIRVYPDAGSTHNDKVLSSGQTSRTFTLDTDFVKSMLILKAPTNSGNYIRLDNFGIQLEYGDTASDYVKHEFHKDTIDFGDNLFDIDTIGSFMAGSISPTSNPITCGKTSISIQMPTGSPEAFSPKVYANATYLGDSAYVQTEVGETYILSYNSYPSYGEKVIVYEYNPDTGEHINITPSSLVAHDRCEFTPTKSGKICIRFGISGTTAGQAITYYNIDLRKANNIRLDSLGGDYTDVIYDKDGEWVIKKGTGIFTPPLTLQYAWDETIPRIYYTAQALESVGVKPVFPESSGDVAKALCDDFKVRSFTDVYTNKKGGFAMSATGKNFQYSDVRWTSSEQAIEGVYRSRTLYAIPTQLQTETAITDQRIIDKLNAVKNNGAYDGTTYIKVYAPSYDLPAKLVVEAPKYE